MEINADQLITDALREGIHEGIKKRLSDGYSNPLDKVLNGALDAQSAELRALLEESLRDCIGNAEFRQSIKDSVRVVLAKKLIERFGGELEKQVNNLKSDPTTRARITLAIEDILAKAT